MAGRAAHASLTGRLGSAMVSVAAAVVVLGISTGPFLTPAWIHAEQARADAVDFTGFDPPTLARVTDSIVHDLVLGGDFAVTAPTPGCAAAQFCRAVQVLDQREVSHMQDVRGVFDGFALLVLVAILFLVLTRVLARRDPVDGGQWWRAVGRGGRWLAVLMAVVGALSIVAFDAAFELFHELLFPAGSFTFDPTTERLVQLFPDQFWSETSLALGILAFVLALALAWLGGRRAAASERRAASEPLAASKASAERLARSAPTTGRSIP